MAGPELADLERHLAGCDVCARALADLAGSWSLEGRAGPPDAPPLGPGTLAMLARLAATPPTGADRPAAPAARAVAPTIPGLADWEVVGRGGMGIVFRAREVDLDRPVAVKVLASGGQFSPSARTRAIGEALMMASVRHPNVVPVYRSGEVDGAPFLVMEWVPGGTLRDRIKERPLSSREAATTVRDLALAVAEAHALGIIHRDLKPENVLLAPGGDRGLGFIPKLTDFGLARRGDGDAMTETGVMLGTPGYMAPEQTGLGGPVGEVGPATDVHGLGAILHACLTGHSPYAGRTTWEILTRTAQGTPPAVREGRPDVPRDLATIVAKCLQAAPARRYRSAGELADDLDRFLAGRPIAARATPAPERWLKWARRHPALAASAALLVAAAGAGAAGAAYHLAAVNRNLRDLATEQGRTSTALDAVRSTLLQSQEALGSLTDDVVQRIMKRGPALNEDDRDFLRRIRRSYETWPLEPNPTAAWLFRGNSLRRLATVFEAIEQPRDAIECREFALWAYEAAAGGGPLTAQLATARLETLMELHRTLGQAGMAAEAEAVARKMITAREPLARDDLRQRANLAWDHVMLAVDLAGQHRDEAADASFATSLDRWEQLRLGDPADPAIRLGELQTLFNIAMCSAQAGRLDRAEAQYRRMADRAEAARADLADRPDLVELHVMALDGVVEVVLPGRPGEALPVQQRLRDQARALVARAPADPRFLRHQIHAAAHGGEILASLGRPGEAEDDLRQAVADATRLALAEPAVFDRSRDLAFTLEASATVAKGLGQERRAVEALDRVAEAFAPWTKLPGRAAEVIARSLAARRESARLLAKLGEHAEAARRLGATLDLVEPPGRPRVHLEVAEHLLAAGDRPGARAAADQAAADPATAPPAARIIATLDGKPTP